MTIGITYNLDINIFQTAIALYELLNTKYNDVILISTELSKKILPDNCESEYNIKHISDITTVDILIDVERQLHKDTRNKVGNRRILFLTSNIQFTELDKSVYVQDIVHNTFDNIHEVWVWDILNTEDSVKCLEPLIKCPIHLIPYKWSSTPTKMNKNYISTFNNTIPTRWNICINERNTDNTSSCIIPLVSLREIENRKAIDADYKLYVKQDIISNKFLTENILNNIHFSELNVNIETKEFDTTQCTSSTIYLSHSRFTPIDTSLIQLLWLGIPVIHNSPILRDFHPILSKLYYNSNQISEICNALQYFSENHKEWFDNREDIRKGIEKEWVYTKDVPILLKKGSLSEKKEKGFIVGFYGMWEGFNVSTNFFTDALRNHVKGDIQIKGIEYTDSVKPDIILYGPFANSYNFPENTPTVFFSGENIPYPENIPTALYLGPKMEESENRIRLPLWMLFIDWFTDSTELPTSSTDNPIRIPVHFARTSHPTPYQERKEFCAFVVSNPSNKLRNDTFHVLDTYKRVNSGGTLFNNIGAPLQMKYPGGGAGDISKFNFFEKHKFTLSFENSQSPGYVTEKVLHAKMAGCVPIYWGDEDTSNDFTPESIVNVSNESSPHDILSRIMELESNIALCYKIASTPILDTEKYNKALHLISRVSDRLLELGGYKTRAINTTKTVIINLDRRKDRYDDLIKTHPFLINAERISAIDGKTLQLTKEIVTLFSRNDFKWKKSVMGCALSHMYIWKKLVNEPDDTRYLILEDDVRFTDTLSEINRKLDALPNDAELVYLGGVLPTNKPYLESVLEPLSQDWAKIKKNTLFTKEPSELFHFCAYSYILTKRGAEKLLNTINKSGCFTSLDHLLNHPQIPIIKYVSNPLVTSCFQEKDSTYIHSDFNNFNRIDTFDSDIWNNNEHFTEEDIIQSTTQNEKQNRILYYLKEYSPNAPFELYERKWIECLFGDIELRELSTTTQPEPGSWYLVMRPHSHFFKNYFLQLDVSYNILHLSDEFIQDNIDFYSYKNCKNVIRNYYRDDTKHLKNVYTIPLGYHYKSKEPCVQDFNTRKLSWSFHGTDWFDRKSKLEKIQDIIPYNCHLTPNWNHTSMSSEEKYVSTLHNSKFCPILKGNNIETFRLYEVLEAGAIPIYVREEGDTAFWNQVTSNIPMVYLENWEKANVFMKYLLKNPEKAEIYRKGLTEKWNEWKNTIRQTIQNL